MGVILESEETVTNHHPQPSLDATTETPETCSDEIASNPKKKSKTKKSKTSPQISIERPEIETLTTESTVKNPEPENEPSTGVVEPVQTVIESISPPPSICTLEISQPLAIDSEDVTSKSKKKSKTKKSKTS